MEVREVSQELAALALTSPDLEILRPTEASYSCFLLQPSGPIFASTARIGGLDTALCHRKVVAFAKLAIKRGAHLAVVPEYFTPWDSVRQPINERIVPPLAALWVLGCHSVKQEELAQFKADMADLCEVLYESCRRLKGTDLFLDDPTSDYRRPMTPMDYRTHEQ